MSSGEGMMIDNMFDENQVQDHRARLLREAQAYRLWRQSRAHQNGQRWREKVGALLVAMGTKLQGDQRPERANQPSPVSRPAAPPEPQKTAPMAEDDLARWLRLYHELRAAIRQLPKPQRQTLILYAEHNLAVDEIAEIMKTSIGRVRVYLDEARQNLRMRLRADTLALFETETQ